MQFFPVRTLLQVAGAVSLAALASQASAQVTLNLTTAQQTNCTAVTDAQGLRLVPGGTDLTATGVTLTGTGCGGSATSDFQAAIQVPGTATAGTPFTVNWSAGAAATQCTYGGTAGLAGWPVGSAACQGAACSGNHAASVTVPSAGNYSLNVTCTNASGYATGNGAATGAPTAPVFTTPLSISPASITLGQSASASWAVNGATSCQGTVTGAATTLANWTDGPFTTSPRSLTPTAAGTYSLQLTCTNSVGSTTSGPVTLAVQAAGDSCPAGQQTTADVCYSNYASSCTTIPNLTFDTVFGHLAIGDTLVPFPGVQSYTTLKNWNKTKYLALKFTVPATGLPSGMFGILAHGETMAGPPYVDMSISSGCGDFTSGVGTICQQNNVGKGKIGAKWKLPTATQTNGCPVQPGQSYYLNIRATNPATANPTDCSGDVCRASFNNNWNTQ